MSASSSSVNEEAADIAAGILKCIQQQLETVINEQLQASDGLIKPTLNIEGYIHEGWEGASPESSQALVPRRIALGSIDISALRAAAVSSTTATPRTTTTTTTTTDASPPAAASTPPTSTSTPSTNEPLALSRPQRARRPPPRHYLSDPEPAASSKRRKATGGIRLPRPDSSRTTTTTTTDDSEHQDPAAAAAVAAGPRQMESDQRSFPQRRKHAPKVRPMQPSTLDRLIVGIWEQIHGSIMFDPQVVIEQWREPRAIDSSDTVADRMDPNALTSFGNQITSFSKMNVLCRRVTTASRCCRSLEVIVQAYWIQCFDARVQMWCEANPLQPLAKGRKAVVMEACEDFGWSEKDLRNKMAVWRGYYEIKEAAGWVALVFAGMGIYRFCKYRVSFDKEAMQRLGSLRHRFEVAADTLQPQWRKLLSFIGEQSEPVYHGHPHDWVVAADNCSRPVPLAMTYLHSEPNFSYEHIDSSILDFAVWEVSDPRDVNANQPTQIYVCDECREVQSDNPTVNGCRCFPTLYGGPRNACPVQVFRTPNGRNNGLIACCPFERGTAVGEFVGLVTQGLRDMDVMQGETNGKPYQIWQGRQGNHTRFVNHSCHPNSQFERFCWLGTQRIVLVSKGIDAGQEITVDYSYRYWSNLDKVCLCGESCCRYKDRRRVEGAASNERKRLE